MSYFAQIRDSLDSYIREIENIAPKEDLGEKIVNHLERTINVGKKILVQRPENYRELIVYIEDESRSFGWSYPDNSDEGQCEDNFWKFKDSLRKLIAGMTANERLYFFGYLEEYEKLSPEQDLDRKRIEKILFIEE